MRIGWAGKVALGAALPVLLGMGAYVLIALDHVADTERAQIDADLTAAAQVLAHALTSEEAGSEALQERVVRMGRAAGIRVTVIAGSGKVLADSKVVEPERMENHGARPEVVQALREGTGLNRRYSTTLNKELLYAAARVPDSDIIVRLAIDVSALERTTAQRTRLFGVVAAVVVAIGILAAIWITRRATTPVRDVALAAVAVARGDLEARVRPRGRDVVARLGDAFNRMAERLQRSLQQAESEAERLAIILEGMTEGVIAVDESEQVSFLNRSARTILGLDEQSEAVGRRLYELVREPRILGLVESAGRRREPAEAEIQQDGPPRRMIEVRAAPVGEEGSGVILVLRDMSKLRRLERMRTDFVSNVSHELRTPLASMSAAIETLEDDRSRADPQTGRRFVEMLKRNAERLDALLEDLLALSRFESQPETLHRVPIDFGALARISVRELEPRARAAGLQLHLRESVRTVVIGDGEALRRVCDNLIVNAIIYTPSGGDVEVEVRAEDHHAVLEVRDTGIGISAADRERIFERFYRVDKARSRSLGGTGLGLAIVKHAVGLHGGTVDVESRLGGGSRFVVRLPLAGEEAPAPGAPKPEDHEETR
jgi:two-component system phosphate regulon sensor histidine kinase PhoR